MPGGCLFCQKFVTSLAMTNPMFMMPHGKDFVPTGLCQCCVDQIVKQHYLDYIRKLPLSSHKKVEEKEDYYQMSGSFPKVSFFEHGGVTND